MQWFFDEYQRQLGIGISGIELMAVLHMIYVRFPETEDNGELLKGIFKGFVGYLKMQEKHMKNTT